MIALLFLWACLHHHYIQPFSLLTYQPPLSMWATGVLGSPSTGIRFHCVIQKWSQACRCRQPFLADNRINTFCRGQLQWKFNLNVDDVPWSGCVFKWEQCKDKSLESLFGCAKWNPTSRLCLHNLLFEKNYTAVGPRLPFVVPCSLRSIVLSAMHDDATSAHMGLARSL